MKKYIYKNIISVSLIIIVSIISFWGIWDIFFQQDEWLGLGRAFSYNYPGGLFDLIFTLFTPDKLIRFLPLSMTTIYFVFNVLGLNASMHGMLALLLVIINALLIWRVTYKISKSNVVALITSIFWVTNNLSSQAITWIGAMIPSQFSMLFFLSSLYMLLVYLDTQRIRWLIFSVLSIFSSLLFKETSLFYPIPFFVLIWFFHSHKFNLRKKISTMGFLLAPLLFAIILPRVFVFNTHTLSKVLIVPPLAVDSIIYNIFLLPARSIFHIYFNNEKIYELFYMANSVHYSSQINGFVVESIIADAFSLLVSFYFLLIIFVITLIVKIEQRKLILFSLISFFTSFLPFIIYKNDAAILEPRYYFFPALWSSLLLGSVLFALCTKLGRWTNALIFLVCMPIIFYNISGLHKSISQSIVTGTYRNGILNTVSEVKPQLKKDNVFYFYTDNNGFYEFQSGFGQTLAVWLYDSGKIPREALTDNDFWNGYEGIKSFDKGKYGYFMTYQKLLNGLKMNPDIDLTSVHAYYWDLQKHTVKNVSVEVREKLKIDLR